MTSIIFPNTTATQDNTYSRWYREGYKFAVSNYVDKTPFKEWVYRTRDVYLRQRYSQMKKCKIYELNLHPCELCIKIFIFTKAGPIVNPCFGL